jgi:hypothetical protein
LHLDAFHGRSGKHASKLSDWLGYRRAGCRTFRGIARVDLLGRCCRGRLALLHGSPGTSQNHRSVTDDCNLPLRVAPGRDGLTASLELGRAEPRLSRTPGTRGKPTVGSRSGARGHRPASRRTEQVPTVEMPHRRRSSFPLRRLPRHATPISPFFARSARPRCAAVCSRSVRAMTPPSPALFTRRLREALRSKAAPHSCTTVQRVPPLLPCPARTPPHGLLWTPRRGARFVTQPSSAGSRCPPTSAGSWRQSSAAATPLASEA